MSKNYYRIDKVVTRLKNNFSEIRYDGISHVSISLFVRLITEPQLDLVMGEEPAAFEKIFV